MSKGMVYLIGALLYVLFPRDVVPDVLGGWGWLDDLIVLYLLWRYYRRQMQLRRSGSRDGTPRNAADDRDSGHTGDSGGGPNDPWAVLGLAPGASREAIKTAYRRLAAQYHPDKVQHLGKDLQDLAEARFKEIQQAYDDLVSR